MTYDPNIKNLAILLRREGSSLGQIASKFNISKSTASLWTTGTKISKPGLKLIKARQDEARKRAFMTIASNRVDVQKKVTKRAISTFQNIQISPSLCKLLAAVFIWTEGEKGKFKRIGFANSDPLMVSTFLSTLRTSFHLNEFKFRALVQIHEYHNETKIKMFWSKVTKIPLNQFTKSYIKPHTGKRIRENYMGSIHINYHDYKIARELAAVYNILASKF